MAYSEYCDNRRWLEWSGRIATVLNLTCFISANMKSSDHIFSQRHKSNFYHCKFTQSQVAQSEFEDPITKFPALKLPAVTQVLVFVGMGEEALPLVSGYANCQGHLFLRECLSMSVLFCPGCLGVPFSCHCALLPRTLHPEPRGKGKVPGNPWLMMSSSNVLAGPGASSWHW